MAHVDDHSDRCPCQWKQAATLEGFTLTGERRARVADAAAWASTESASDLVSDDR